MSRTMRNWLVERSGAGLRVRGTLQDGTATIDGFTLTGVREIVVSGALIHARLGDGRSVVLAVQPGDHHIRDEAR